MTKTRATAIAVIGLGCRFPGGIDSPRAYWRFLEQGLEAITSVSPNRWPESKDCDGDPARRGARWAGLLDDVNGFDAGFFGISPLEARSLDPQQRLLLEVAWEALEEAGRAPAALMGSRTGIYIGATNTDHRDQLLADSELRVDAYATSGSVLAFCAGRLAFVLGTRGPALTVDSACSSSLVAVHLACQALRDGEIDIALAGGVNVLLSPSTTAMLISTQALSPDGRCKAFDALANGFVRGEGCGVIVLSRLEDALAVGARTWAVIRGSAVNQDGRSAGLMAPNGQAQEELLRAALRNACVAPDQIGYLEAHGTGTPLGDPIEMDAIRAVVGGARADGSRCLVGSVKTNFGHLEAAAGIAGFIKTVLALHHESIPRHLHLKHLNPRIAIDGSALSIPTVAVPWPRNDKPRFAGVSAFGLSGTNAHVVLEEAPAAPPPGKPRPWCVLALSAAEPKALEALAQAYREFLAAPENEHDFGAIARTAAAGRSHFAHRIAVAASDCAGAAAELQSIHSSEARGTPPRIAFRFSGDTTETTGNPGNLYQREPVFRKAMDECAALADLHSSAQVALVAMQVALVALWQSWGVIADLVLGEGIGNASARYALGQLSLDQLLQNAALGESFDQVRDPRAKAGAGEIIVEIGPGGGDLRRLMETLALLYVAGAEIDWQGVYGANGPSVSLPTYPFQRRSFGRPGAKGDQQVVQVEVGPDDQPLLQEHRFFGVPVVPAAFYLATVLNMLDADEALTGVTFPSPLVIERASAAIRFTRSKENFVAESDERRIYATGAIQSWTSPDLDNNVFSRPEPAGEDAAQALYAKLASLGIELGAGFCWAKTVWRASDEAILHLRRPEPHERDPRHRFHVGQIDTVLQTIGAIIPSDSIPHGRVCVPVSIESMRARSGVESLAWSHGRLRADGSNLVADLRAYDEAGHLAIAVDGFRIAWIAPEVLNPAYRPASEAAVTQFIRLLRSAPAAGRRALLRDHVRAAAAEVLHLGASVTLSDSQPFTEVGLDSIAAVEMAQYLEGSAGRRLSDTLLFDYPTVERLTRHLAELLLLEPGPAAAPAAERHAQQSHDAIAIVGMGCRFPGGVDSPDALWDLLKNGIEAVGEIPGNRWDVDAWHDPAPDAAGKMYSTRMASLADVDRFDAAFFGITPREAKWLDPQQRLLLEVCWEALEHANIPPDSLSGSSTGVFIGISTADYARHHLMSGDPSRIEAMAATGTAFNSTAGRISYTFGFQGPNLAVDTACSGSLVAVHLACHSLLDGESDIALAGGVNLILSPEYSVYFSKVGALSPSGHCRAFDAAADGYVRGEGCGVVVLKRLADAQASGDRIMAVIRGTAVNQDGRSQGFTAPNGPAQEAVIRRALHRAGVAPHEVGYVEAHGTGTPLGDPIEIQALGHVYDEGRSVAHPLWVGSLKSNIGHLEAASGVASLIKAVLCLQNREIPASLHIATPNPSIAWNEITVRPVIQATSWPMQSSRLAGVSAFGFSGTNAHVIIGEGTADLAQMQTLEGPQRPLLLPLSARTTKALRAVAEKWCSWLRSTSFDATSIAYTATCRRTHHPLRLAVIGESVSDWIDALEAWSRSQSAERVLVRPGESAGPLGEIAESYVAGQPLEWSTAQLGGCSVPLPSYPWQKERYWIEPPTGVRPENDPLLGERLSSSTDLIEFESPLGAHRPPFLAGHRIGEHTVMPGAGLLSMASGAMRIVGGTTRHRIDDLRFHQPLLLGERSRTVRTTFTPIEDGWSLGISSRAEGEQWQLHASGRVSFHTGEPRLDLGAIRARCTEERSATALYEELRELGYTLSPDFARVTRVCRRSGESLCTIDRAGSDWGDEHRGPHPGLLDSCFHAVAAALPGSGPSQRLTPGSLFVPVKISSAEFFGFASGRLNSHATISTESVNGFAALLTIADDAGRVVARLEVEFQSTLPAVLFGEPRGTRPGRLYRIDWRPAALPQTVDPSRRRWLIVADRGGFAAKLAAPLLSRGDNVEVVDTSQLGSVLVVPDAIVHLPHLDVDDGASLDSRPSPEACGSILEVVRWLDAAPFTSQPRLWIVTRSSTSQVAPFPALAWGMARVLAHEHPKLRPACIDIDDDESAEPLLAVLLADGAEDQTLLRGNQVLASRLAVADETVSNFLVNIRPAGRYLITGCGALGLAVAGWLANRGATRLTFVTRSEPDPVAVSQIDRLRDTGVLVDVVQADVTVIDDLARAFAIDDAPLRGIVHTAGILADTLATQLDHSRWRQAVDVKLVGALNLHHLSLNVPLDFFVLFSSAVAFLGLPGQGNYAAANAALDALAQRRRSLGLAATSIGWGPWIGGMATAAAGNGRSARQGIHPLTFEDGLRLFGEILQQEQAYVAAMAFDIDSWRGATAVGLLPFFSELQSLSGNEPDGEIAQRNLRSLLEEAASAERVFILRDFINRELAKSAALEEEETPTAASFDEAGMTSLMALEVSQRLEDELAMHVSPSALWNHPSSDRLAAHLLEKLNLALPAIRANPAPRDDLDAMLQRIKSLSPGEIDQWITQKNRERSL